MVDEWDKYKTDTKDEWSQYSVSNDKRNGISDFLGGVAGLGGAGAVGYGLLKSKIPQNIGKGVKSIARGVSNLPKVTNVNKGDAFAKEIRGEFIKSHTNKINEFGSDLAKWQAKNPSASVNLSELVTDIQADPNLTGTSVKILRKTPVLEDLLKNPKLAENVSLKDTQKIINHLNGKIKSGGFDIQEAINSVKGSQLESFPEMSETRANYAKFIEPYKQVKPYFKFNRLLNAMKNNFGGAEGQVAVESILPKEIINKIRGYRSAANIAEIPNNLPIVGKVLKGLGGVIGVAPQALQVFNLWRLRNDPEAQYNAMLGGGELPPKGSLEREVQQGRVL